MLGNFPKTEESEDSQALPAAYDFYQDEVPAP